MRQAKQIRQFYLKALEFMFKRTHPLQPKIIPTLFNILEESDEFTKICFNIKEHMKTSYPTLHIPKLIDNISSDASFEHDSDTSFQEMAPLESTTDLQPLGSQIMCIPKGIEFMGSSNAPKIYAGNYQEMAAPATTNQAVVSTSVSEMLQCTCTQPELQGRQTLSSSFYQERAPLSTEQIGRSTDLEKNLSFRSTERNIDDNNQNVSNQGNNLNTITNFSSCLPVFPAETMTPQLFEYFTAETLECDFPAFEK